MEENSDNCTKLNINLNTQILYGSEFIKKINDLKIFIYGLKGVTKYK